MSEIARLDCEMDKEMTVTLVLTPTHLILEPNDKFREKVLGQLEKGIDKAGDAPGFFGWIARSAVHFASNTLDKVFAPHPLDETDLVVTHDKLSIKVKRFPNMGMNGLKVNSEDAFIFEAKFRQAREALG